MPIGNRREDTMGRLRGDSGEFVLATIRLARARAGRLSEVITKVDLYHVSL
jgi:hypothetical protein